MYCNVRALVAQAIMRSGLFRDSLPDHLLLEAKHTFEILAFVVVLFAGLRVMRIRVMAVEKLDDMETAFIDIEMDVPCLKIRCASFPDFCARICYFFS